MDGPLWVCLYDKWVHTTGRKALMQEHFFEGDSLFRRVLLYEAIGEKQYTAVLNRFNRRKDHASQKRKLQKDNLGQYPHRDARRSTAEASDRHCDE